MQFLKTIIWIALTILLVAFIAINWDPVRVNVWPLEQGYLYVDWPVGFIVLMSFLAGLLPMWLLHKGARWRLKRRIDSLENTVRATTPTPPMGTTTQLDAAKTE